MVLTTIGDKSRTIFLTEESHKLHIEFTVEAGETIRPGMPVKLHTNGKIKQYVTGDVGTTDILGIAVHNAIAGQVCTVIVRGYLTLNAYSAAAISPGMAKIGGFYYDANTGEAYNTIATASVTLANFNGWVLDSAAAANGLVRFLVKG